MIATWGGSYEAAQRARCLRPFTARTGIPVTTQFQNGGLQVLQTEPLPDLVDMLEKKTPNVPAGRDCCWKPIFAALLAAGSEGMSERDLHKDFQDDSLSSCGVAHLTFATVVAYDARRFPGQKPLHIRDFLIWNRFPGKRGLRREPAAILEWALLADGVPLSQVYGLLSTERGMRLALRRLDSIRDAIVWVGTPGAGGGTADLGTGGDEFRV
ncbi:MAG: hypothetical protein R3E89_14425 [Thiolinea sp.]